jgi:hypothetical protein
MSYLLVLAFSTLGRISPKDSVWLDSVICVFFRGVSLLFVRLRFSRICRSSGSFSAVSSGLSCGGFVSGDLEAGFLLR